MCFLVFLNGCALQNTIIINEKITGGEISQAQFIQMVYDGEGIE